MDVKLNMQTLVSVWIYVVSVALLVCAEEPRGDTGTTNVATTDHMEIHLSIFHMQSNTDTILVAWNITTNKSIRSYEVHTQRQGSHQMVLSGPLPSDTGEYEVEDLVADAAYNVCVVVRITDQAFCAAVSKPCRKCVPLSTIPIIRDDSLIALILTILVIIILIIIGILCWRCAISKKSKGDDGDDASDTGSESAKPILLAVPPTSNGPRRSVDFEDQDIPYITPPIEQAPAAEATQPSTTTPV